jgi:DNA-binding Lrp family transcriptional regulator
LGIPAGETMDKLDIAILRLLNRNARRSFRDIALELEVSLSTVSNRVRKLEDDGIILGYAPIIAPEKVGYDLFAVIGVRIAHGRLLEVQKKIAKDSRVYGVYDVTGDWDCMLTARFRNRKEMNDFIKNMTAMENVERTYTQLVLNVVKEETRVGI